MKKTSDRIQLRMARKVQILENMIEDLTRELYLSSEQNKHLERFASIASHDLKKPINNIISISRLARMSDDTNYHDQLNLIDESAQRMASIIEALLEFSKVDYKPKLEACDLNELVAEVISDIQDHVSECHAQIAYQDLPVVQAEKPLLGIVFQNLISNAIKFVPTGRTPHVQISAVVEEHFWTVTIQDNGIGIRPEHRESIFNLLTRLEPVSYEGLGIGLATCRRIVDNHGGKIAVEDHPDGGSVFRFSLAKAN